MITRLTDAITARPVGLTYLMDPLGHQQSFDGERELMEALDRWIAMYQRMYALEQAGAPGTGRGGIALARREPL